MTHHNILSVSPILNGNMRDVNMARPFSKDTNVDHIDGRHVVFIKWSGTVFGIFNFQEDSMTIFGVLGFRDG